MRFDRISILIDQLRPWLDKAGWHHASSPVTGSPVTAFVERFPDSGTAGVGGGDGGAGAGLAPGGAGAGGSGIGVEIRKSQTGVVRSNCMDCLDRTNVSQSALGQWAINEQLRHAGILSVKEKITDHPDFMAIFRTGKESLPALLPRFLSPSILFRLHVHTTLPEVDAYAMSFLVSTIWHLISGNDLLTPSSAVWADHGDTVSKAYSGTGALKADFTRTGTRTKQGALEDGYKSVMRYITNNFFDGDRQVSCFFRAGRDDISAMSRSGGRGARGGARTGLVGKGERGIR